MRTKVLPAEKNPALLRATAALLGLGTLLLYCTYSYLQWIHYVTPSWDLGIFSQLAKAYANLQEPIVPIKGEGYNLLGDHFHPLTLLLGPVYALFPSPLSLLYLQNGLIALATYLLVRWAQRVLHPLLAASLGAAYALSFGVQEAVAVQFHEVAFSQPLLMMSLGYLVLAPGHPEPARLIRRSVYWAAPLVFVKEDMGMSVALLGLLALFRTGWPQQALDLLFPRRGQPLASWKERGRALVRSWLGSPAVAESSLLILWGLAWSLLAVGVILPFFNSAGVFDYSDKLNIPALLADPLGSFSQLFYPWQKSLTLLLLLITGALAWLASPLALLVLPTLLWRFLSPQEGYWEPTWHYNLVLMPLVFMALLDSLARLQKTPRKSLKLAPSLPALSLGPIKQKLSWALPALALLTGLILTPNLPLADLANPAFASFQENSEDREKAQALQALPSGSSVAADLSLLTYLVPDHQVYWIGYSGQPAPDYVLIDLEGSAWGGRPPESAVAYAQGRYGQAQYSFFKRIGSIEIAVRTG